MVRNVAETAVVYSDEYLRHDTGRGHPERAERLRAIMQGLRENMFFEREFCSLVKPDMAAMEDLELVHELDYIRLVERYCRSGGGVLDLGDTVVSKESFEVARYAVGGCLKAVKLVCEGKFRNAFAFVRPPGHHAGAFYARGFCIFNNVAIAATHLVRNQGLRRVLIIDIDAHHGNGTQDIFYDSAEVLYAGLHQDPTGFPGTGFIDEVGEGEGEGYTVNIPFPFRVNDTLYLEAFDQIISPIAEQYKPEFVLVSAGFDMHYTDPVASLSLSTLGYETIFSKILNIASRSCNGKVVAVLEGGYSLSFLGKMASAAIAKMCNAPYSVEDEVQKVSERTLKKTKAVVSRVKRVQSRFWNLK